MGGNHILISVFKLHCRNLLLKIHRSPCYGRNGVKPCWQPFITLYRLVSLVTKFQGKGDGEWGEEGRGGERVHSFKFDVGPNAEISSTNGMYSSGCTK